MFLFIYNSLDLLHFTRFWKVTSSPRQQGLSRFWDCHLFIYSVIYDYLSECKYHCPFCNHHKTSFVALIRFLITSTFSSGIPSFPLPSVCLSICCLTLCFSLSPYLSFQLSWTFSLLTLSSSIPLLLTDLLYMSKTIKNSINS